MDTAAPALNAVPAGGIPVSTSAANPRAALAYYATHFLGVPAQDASALIAAVCDELANAGTRGRLDAAAADGYVAAREMAPETLFSAVRRAASANGHGARHTRDRLAAQPDDASPSLASRIESLTPKQQEALWLRCSQGFGPELLSRITGLSARNVHFLLHSALAKLHGDTSAAAAGNVAGAIDYVLNEMDDGAAAAFATELQRDPATKAAVGELRALLAEITATLPHRRETSEAAPSPAMRRGGWRKPLALAATLLGVAATIALTVARWNRSPPELAVGVRHNETVSMKPDPWRLANSPPPPADPVRTASVSGATALGSRSRSLATNPLRAKPPEGDAPISRVNSGSTPGEESEAGARTTSDGGGGGGASQSAAASGPGGGTGANAEAPNTALSGSPSTRAAVVSARQSPANGENQPPAPAKGGPSVSAQGLSSGRPHPSAAPPGAAAGNRSSQSPPAARDASLAAVATLRTALAAHQWPVSESVSAEALLEYFAPDRAREKTGTQPAAPITATVEVAAAPWAPERRLVRVVVQATPAARSVHANLVLLIDVSGSMDAPNRLPLVREAVRRILHHLQAEDRVAIVTYAGEARVVLPSTPAQDSPTILTAIGTLEPKGLTHGSAGLRAAYAVARENLVVGGVNRVVLCTDGDFNLGETNEDALVALVEAQVRLGVELHVYGFGRGRRIDPRLEALAACGGGRSGNLNTWREAERQLAPDVAGRRAVVAQAVRVDFEPDPASASTWLRVGADANFLPWNARERPRMEMNTLSAGETATALFEVQPSLLPPGSGPRPRAAGTLRVGYTLPATGEEQVLRVPITDTNAGFGAASADLRFAAAVAGLGLALRTPPPTVRRLDEVVTWAEAAAADLTEDDPGGYRAEFLALAREARELAGREAAR